MQLVNPHEVLYHTIILQYSIQKEIIIFTYSIYNRKFFKPLVLSPKLMIKIRTIDFVQKWIVNILAFVSLKTATLSFLSGSLMTFLVCSRGVEIVKYDMSYGSSMILLATSRIVVD